LKKPYSRKKACPYLLNPDEMVFENGDTILKEGNSDTNFFKLIQGCLEVLKGTDKIAEISQRDTYFGEMSALLGGRRTATIRSVGKSIVKVFPGDKLLETLEGYPDISKQVITSLVARLEDTNKRLVEVINAKTDMERTLKAVAPHAAGQVASRIPFGKAAAAGGAPKPTASQFRARTGGAQAAHRRRQRKHSRPDH
jgi:CRP-like cAMP-binding protein